MKLTRTQKFLLFIFILAVVLRFVAAYHMHVSTVEMIISIISLNIIDAGRLGTIDQAPLYFYLTDLSYKLFGGITPISLRLTNIIFGSLSAIAVFLIAKELFNNDKVSLIAAFLAAISGFSINYNYVMDTLSFFFRLLSLFFFVRFIHKQKYSIYFSSLFLALGILVNPYIIVFIPIYVILWFLYWLSEKYTNKTSSVSSEPKRDKSNQFVKIILCLLIITILLSPILIYNYFTYTQLGITDTYFTEKFGLGNGEYGGVTDISWSFSWIPIVSQSILKDLWNFDGFIIMMGLIGIFLLLYKRHPASFVIFPFIILYYLYMAGEDGRSTFYIIIPLLLSIYAGYSVYFISDFIQNKFKFKYSLYLLLGIAVILTFGVMQDVVGQREDSITLALRDYAVENIPDNALVIVDPRIYTGIYTWTLNNKHYLPSHQFLTLLKNGGNIPGTPTEVPLYYIECGPGTRCGWQPDQFKSLSPLGEEAHAFFEQTTEKIAEIKAIDTIIVYRALIEVPSGLFPLIDQSHSFLYYSVGWKNMALSIDNYQVQGFFPKLIHFVGLAILYFEVFLALLSIPFVFYLAYRKSESNEEINKV